ncbi:MAG TPA: non-heme iron oxygenase ferredoxin subunit [Steroidobacteraceae bacterium]|jgi:3-phenylpropionate/trans-cinnamate dioxygenase ferredoxin subunit|nr:non-heme iron oxygenase ferredoxin subunit [Steroidobacteraceae bacterium]
MSGQWVDVGAAQEVTDTHSLSVELDEVALIVARCGADLYAVENRCTHDGESLAGAAIEACEIICPRHGARFCLKSGAALTPPAYEPLRTFKVRVAAGRILLQLPT